MLFMLVAQRERYGIFLNTYILLSVADACNMKDLTCKIVLSQKIAYYGY